MTTFKKIVKCLQEGGSVYCFDVDMHVLGHFDGMLEQYIILGNEEDKSICLSIDSERVEEKSDQFNFYDKDGEEWER